MVAIFDGAMSGNVIWMGTPETMIDKDGHTSVTASKLSHPQDIYLSGGCHANLKVSVE